MQLIQDESLLIKSFQARKITSAIQMSDIIESVYARVRVIMYTSITVNEL